MSESDIVRQSSTANPVAKQRDISDPTFQSPKDRARFVVSPAFGGIEIMHACFVDHAFTPHTHEELMIGVLHSGVKRFQRERKTHRVTRYGLSINNAGDLHTGERAEGHAIGYSALYLPGHVFATIRLPSDFAFKDAVIEDREVWAHLARATVSHDRMAMEEAIACGLTLAAHRRGGRIATRQPRAETASIAGAAEAMHARYEEPLGLVELAEIAGLSVRQLIRAFEVHKGVTPHRYLTSLRITHARDALRQGGTLADVAVGAGFADQAHFSRVFRAVMGTTPGCYQAAVVPRTS